MTKMCTVSRLERQFATLCLFHAPTGGGSRLEGGYGVPVRVFFDLYGVIKRGNTTSRVPPTSRDPSHFPSIGGRFGYFYFFLFGGGESKEASEQAAGGSGLLLEIKGRGGVVSVEQVGRVRHRRWEHTCREGGMANIFFRAEMPTKQRTTARKIIVTSRGSEEMTKS